MPLPLPPIPDGYFAPLSAEALLAAEHRQRLLARIWQKAFEKLNLHQRSANGQNIWVCCVHQYHRWDLVSIVTHESARS